MLTLKIVYTSFQVSLEVHERKFTRTEAVNQVNEWFPGSDLKRNVETYLSQKEENSKPKDTYSIFEVIEAVSDLIKKEKDSLSQWEMHMKKLEKEYEIAISNYKEGDFGSGFIVGKHLVLTAKHVIQDHLDDKNRNKVVISHPKIQDQKLPCEVVKDDPSTDLALLFCEELDCNIPQLPLSGESPEVGTKIFSAGYPLVGDQAMVVEGMVSSTVERFGDNRPSLMVLQCPGFHGFSGGPVVRQIDNQLTVVGMLVQKQVKSSLTMDEYSKLQEVKDLVESGEANVTEREKKLYEVLCQTITGFEMEKQDGFLRALPGKFIVHFVKNQ